ncbi:MAG: hypothetical protein GY850_20250, partial [bacterium]|nr:hypothetical protein [bacterium]
REVEEIFARARDSAARTGIELILPPVFAAHATRACPYRDHNAAVIRADGEVVPCLKYLYPHKSYLSFHERAFSPHSFGNISNGAFADIWNSRPYKDFRHNMDDMNENIAWCGDCKFSSNSCFFVQENTSDCLTNRPFCGECPYSLNLTRCLL